MGDSCEVEQKEKKKIGGEKKKKVTFTTLHFHNLALFHLEKKMNRWLREEAEAVTNREPLLGSGEVRLRERCLDKDQKGEKGRDITNSGKEKETTPCKALVVFWCFINMCMSFICTHLLRIVSAIWQHGTRSLISLALCLTLFFLSSPLTDLIGRKICVVGCSELKAAAVFYYLNVLMFSPFLALLL